MRALLYVAGISYSAPKGKLRKEAAKKVYATLSKKKKKFFMSGSQANEMIIFATVIAVAVVIVSFSSAGLK